MNTSTLLILFLMFATLGVLVAGVVVMARGGKINKKYSNKLMQARIWFQAITILILILVIALAKN